MELIREISELRRCRQVLRHARRTLALVPTMGSLHDGHLSLVEHAAVLAHEVWVTIFVNPTQFGPNEDLDRYPRDLKRDLELLRPLGPAVVFAPSETEMYPTKPVVQIGFSGLDEVLCGAGRPGHFAGVGLVVSKLFNVTEPDVAVFGQKDAQQALLIRRLAAELNFPVHVEVAPTVREADGLALSSRNAYLSSEERAAAPAIFRALRAGEQAVRAGERDPRKVEALMRKELGRESLLHPEYVACVSQENLQAPATIAGPLLLAIAAHAGSTRLIDNLPIQCMGE